MGGFRGRDIHIHTHRSHCSSLSMTQPSGLRSIYVCLCVSMIHLDVFCWYITRWLHHRHIHTPISQWERDTIMASGWFTVSHFKGRLTQADVSSWKLWVGG